VIDGHAHPFDLELRELELSRVAIDVAEMGAGGDGSALLWRSFLRGRLAARLGVDAADLSAARREAAADYPRYVRGLFADAGIDEIVMDPAWPPGSAERVAEFARLAGCRVHVVFRVEPVVDALLEQAVGFDELLERVDQALQEAVRRGVPGLKIAIAYRTGLAVDPEVTERTARASLAEPGPIRRRAKALRDHLCRRVLGFAADTALPVQIHTGFGDSDLRLAESNPLLLEELLRTPEGRRATVIVLHAGYPFVEQAAYLAAAWPNVHVDLSLVPLWAPARVADTLRRVLGLAPVERVLAGTDAWGPPEAFWVAATILREAWEQVQADHAALGAPQAWLRDATDVLEENARRLYRLDGGG
jgi:predicted TIM-barrel fold metal-dependent hydrolase